MRGLGVVALVAMATTQAATDIQDGGDAPVPRVIAGVGVAWLLFTYARLRHVLPASIRKWIFWSRFWVCWRLLLLWVAVLLGSYTAVIGPGMPAAIPGDGPI